MAGEEVASGYLSIGPALVKDFRQKLDAQLKPVAAEAGRNFGQSTAVAMREGVGSSTPALQAAGRTAGAAITTGVQQEVGPRLKKVLDQAASDGKVTFATKIKGIGASLADEFKATGGISQTLGTVRSSMRLTREDLGRLREGMQGVASQSGVLRGGLAGVSGLLGGPWGIALAGAGLALNGFATAQQNADEAAKGLLETLDKQTGAFTGSSAADLVGKIVKDLDRPGDIPFLKTLGVDLKDATKALLSGDDALQAYLDKLEALKGQYRDGSAESQRAQRVINGLQESLRNQNETIFDTRQQWELAAEAQRVAAGVTEDLGLKTDETGKKMQALASHVKTTVAAINSIPGGATVEITTNLAQVISEARQAAAALSAVSAAGAQYSAGAAINDYLAGLGSGKYEDPIAAAQKKAEDAAKEAERKAKEAAANARREAAAAARKARQEAAAAAKRAREEARREAERQRLEAERESKRDAIRSNISSTLTNARALVQPNITQLPRSAPGIKRALAKQLDTVRRFRKNINILAKRGIPRIFLEQLLAAGLDGAEQAQALVNAKDADFNEIRRLTKELNTEAGRFGKQSLDLLYGTGVNAAKALISGLDSQQAAIEKQMIKIARGMEKAIKKALGIASPSKVGLSIGRNYGLSIAGGIGGTQRAVDRASATLVRPPRPVTVDRSNVVSIAGMRPLIEGGLHMHNPVERSLNGSATDALRTTAYLLGTGS